MKRRIIIYSPTLYSFICFIINFILWLGMVLLVTLPFYPYEGKFPFWACLILSFLFIIKFWFIFLMHKKNTFYEWYAIPFINSATATSETFIFFHKDQKTKELENGFKLIKIFGTFTSWFWLFALIFRKDQKVKQIIEAFKKFVSINEKIYRIVDLEDKSLGISSIKIDPYTLVEI